MSNILIEVFEQKELSIESRETIIFNLWANNTNQFILKHNAPLMLNLIYLLNPDSEKLKNPCFDWVDRSTFITQVIEPLESPLEKTISDNIAAFKNKLKTIN